MVSQQQFILVFLGILTCILNNFFSIVKCFQVVAITMLTQFPLFIQVSQTETQLARLQNRLIPITKTSKERKGPKSKKYLEVYRGQRSHVSPGVCPHFTFKVL